MFNRIIKNCLMPMFLALLMIAPMSTADVYAADAELTSGVNFVSAGATDTTYTVDSGKALAIDGTKGAVVFDGCTFNVSGSRVNLKGFDGSYTAKIATKGDVTFKNCTFTFDGVTGGSGGSTASLAILRGSNVKIENSNITTTNNAGQFTGLYGQTELSFSQCVVSTKSDTSWDYVTYPNNGETATVTFDACTVTGTDNGVRSFATNQNNESKATSIVNIKNGTKLTFDDNKSGAFVFGPGTNKVNIDDSTVSLCNNGGNASNGGIWTVNNSSLKITGNRSGHGLSCNSFAMKDSEFVCVHNGFSGTYIQSADSSFTNCDVTIKCNGENNLGYSGGDTWLNEKTLTVDNCKDAWLGAVGRKGSVVTTNGSTVVAADLDTLGTDNHSGVIKSKCAPVLEKADVVDGSTHTLFINANIDSAYPRGNTEGDAVSYVMNDADLWDDVPYDSEGNALEGTMKDIVTAAGTKLIAQFTDAELAHHNYDFANGEITDKATAEKYGVKAFKCTTCNEYVANKDAHQYSRNCNGTFVYAPVVGVEFKANTKFIQDESITDEMVSDMPETLDSLDYGAAFSTDATPVLEGYTFEGWFLDEDCNEPFVAETELTDNWTVLYASWRKDRDDTDKPGNDPENPGDGGNTGVNTGDDSQILFYAVLAFASVIAAVFTMRRRFQK